MQRKTRYNCHQFIRQHSDWAETVLFAKDIDIETFGSPEWTPEESVDIKALRRALPNLTAGSGARRFAGKLVRRAPATRRQFELSDLVACPVCKEPLRPDLRRDLRSISVSSRSPDPASGSRDSVDCSLVHAYRRICDLIDNATNGIGRRLVCRGTEHVPERS